MAANGGSTCAGLKYVEKQFPSSNDMTEKDKKMDLLLLFVRSFVFKTQVLAKYVSSKDVKHVGALEDVIITGSNDLDFETILGMAIILARGDAIAILQWIDSTVRPFLEESVQAQSNVTVPYFGMKIGLLSAVAIASSATVEGIIVSPSTVLQTVAPLLLSEIASDFKFKSITESSELLSMIKMKDVVIRIQEAIIKLYLNRTMTQKLKEGTVTLLNIGISRLYKLKHDSFKLIELCSSELDLLKNEVKVDGFDKWLCSHCPQWNTMDVTTCTGCETSIFCKIGDKQSLYSTMSEDTFIEYHVHTAVVQGEARAGKTSVKSLLLSQPYDNLSTNLIEAPSIGCYSVSRYGNSRSGKTWTLVEEEEMSEKVMGELQATAKEIPFLNRNENTTTPSRSHSNDLSKKSDTSEGTPSVTETKKRLSSTSACSSFGIFDDAVIVSETDYKKEATIAVSEFIKECEEANEAKRLGKHHDWLYLIDSGGQIQFQKLLPAFMPCASVLILVINLATNLSAPSSTAMQLRDEIIQVSERSIKVEEVLKQLLSAITSAAHQYRSIIAQDEGLKLSIEPPPEMLNVITVATHRDEYDEQLASENHKNLESLEEKEEKLCQIFESVANMSTVIRKEEPPYSIMHEVDGRKAKTSKYNDTVIERIAKKLKSQAYKIKVPLKWHCFGVILRKEAKKGCGVLSLSSCQAIGESCQLSNDEVISALKFFHTLNMLLYYPDSHTAHDIVFVSPDSLIEIIKDLMLVVCSFHDKWRRAPSDIRDLITQGCLSVEVLKKSKNFRKIAEKFPNFEAKVLGVFHYLLIAAKLPDTDRFLMPALLPVKDVSDMNPFPKTTPLLFYFDTGLPMGLFCAVLVHLLSMKIPSSSSTDHDTTRNHWVLISSSDTCSNHLTLEKYNTKGSNIFVEGLNYIEIYAKYPDYRVADVVENAIKVTMKKRKLSEKEKAVRAFHCPCQEGGPKHAAIVVGNEHEYVLRCTVTNRSVENKKAGLWFEKRTSTSSPNFSELTELLSDISDKWYELGVPLGVPDHVRNGLRDNHSQNTIRLIKVLEYWRDNSKVPYTWQSVKDAVCHPIVNVPRKIKDIDTLLLI